MKTVLMKHARRSEDNARCFSVHMTVRGFPKKARFRLLAADAESGTSFFNGEYEMGTVTPYYFTIEVPSDIDELLIRCRDTLSRYQCWERVFPIKEALNQGICIDVRKADFGKGLGEAMRKVF